MRKLYAFHWDCGRMGHLDGVFVCEESEILRIMGFFINFGSDVLGKHSEIYGTLREKDIKLLSEDQEFIDKTIECGLVPSGYNPLDYCEEEE